MATNNLALVRSKCALHFGLMTSQITKSRSCSPLPKILHGTYCNIPIFLLKTSQICSIILPAFNHIVSNVLTFRLNISKCFDTSNILHQWYIVQIHSDTIPCPLKADQVKQMLQCAWMYSNVKPQASTRMCQTRQWGLTNTFHCYKTLAVVVSMSYLQ